MAVIFERPLRPPRGDTEERIRFTGQGCRREGPSDDPGQVPRESGEGSKPRDGAQPRQRAAFMTTQFTPPRGLEKQD